MALRGKLFIHKDYRRFFSMNYNDNTLFSSGEKSQQKGFTLIELMIVIVIVGILAAIGVPAYQDSVKKGKRADAQGVLMNAANNMERFFTSNGTYTGATPGTHFIDQAPATGTAIYDVSVVPTASSYVLTATPVSPGSMTGDGNLTLSSTGARTWGTNTCWATSC
jgi:type IV pilus assembly protein PilE